MQVRIAIAPILVLLLLNCGGGHSFGEDQAQSPAAAIPQAPRRQSFFDYALGKINPKDEDYGAKIGSARKVIVEATIDDLYFWSNAVTLAFLCCLTTLFLLGWRAADKREAIAASLIAQLWNGRASDRIEIEKRTEQFNRLAETHNRQVEQSLSQKSTNDDTDAEATGKLRRSVCNLRESDTKRASAESPRSVIKPTTTADVSLINLQQDKLLLQRRVEALQNSEQNLKQRLNQTTVLLDQERRRNGTLKGA